MEKIFSYRLTALRRISPFALFIVVVLAASLPQHSALSATAVTHPDKANPLLAPCTMYDDYYEDLPFESDNFDKWPEKYHETVQKIIEEHFTFMQRTVDCSAGSLEALLPAQSELKGLSKKLPTWQENRGKVPPIRQTDIGPVLLEFLNVYECAMQERFYFLTVDAWDTVKKKKEEENEDSIFDISGDSSSESDISYSEVLGEMWKETMAIEHELKIARDLLNRVLAIVEGPTRLLALDAEMQCIEGASMDLRNAAALAAEASTCLPRIWNAKDPLRDIQ